MKKDQVKTVICLLLILLVLSCKNSQDKTNTVDDNSRMVTEEPDLNGWEIGNYVDDFGDPIDQSYVLKQISGQFSNTAANNDKLSVIVLVDSTSLRFKLYEYGNMLVKAPSLDVYYAKVKMPDGTDSLFYAYGSESGYIEISYNGRERETDDWDLIRQMLINREDIKIRFENLSDNHSIYLFKIEGRGLSEALNTANIPLTPKKTSN